MKQVLTVNEVDGFIEGNGPQTLVMIHGWPDTYRIWEKQIEFFKTRYRCAYFTLPGFDHDKSRQAFSLDQVIETIKAVVDEASPDQPVHLILHDWGCFYGYQYAMRYPQRVASIVGVDVGDANSRAFLKSITPKKAAMIAGYQLPLALAWRIGGAAGRQIARGVAKTLKTPSALNLIRANMGYPYYIQWTQKFGSFKGARDLDFQCPLLYIYGKNKPLMFHSKAWLEQLEQHASSKVEAFNTSHWVMVEAPEQFNQTVQDWLSTL